MTRRAAAISWAGSLRSCIRSKRIGMYPKKVTGSSSKSSATSFVQVDTDARAGVLREVSAHDQLASAYQLSAHDHSQVIADQISMSFSLCVSNEALYIGQPLQRLSPPASGRPQKEAEHSARRRFPQLPPTLAEPE